MSGRGPHGAGPPRPPAPAPASFRGTVCCPPRATVAFAPPASGPARGPRPRPLFGSGASRH
eukprot:10280795-Alexandrium_andersonii.AAC.1